MSDRPILFSASMIRAMLEGRKTQDREIIKLPHKNPLGVWEASTIGGKGVSFKDGTPASERACIWHTRTGDCILTRYQIGDKLWVKEACQADELQDGTCVVRCLADNAFSRIENTEASGDRWLTLYNIYKKHGALCHPKHMPRWASRLTLIVTGVKIERLQDISEADAIAEGVSDEFCDYELYGQSEPYRYGYSALWDSINKTATWDENPWVIATTYDLIKANIDEVA